MRRRVLRICGAPGCAELCEKGLCPEHDRERRARHGWPGSRGLAPAERGCGPDWRLESGPAGAWRLLVRVSQHDAGEPLRELLVERGALSLLEELAP